MCVRGVSGAVEELSRRDFGAERSGANPESGVPGESKSARQPCDSRDADDAREG